MLAQNPKLRVVGAHLGSLENSLDELARRLDRYSNFAVDTAARVASLAAQPREEVRQFLIKYQDRILYGTDLSLYDGQNAEITERGWEARYATEWAFFSSGAIVNYHGRKVQGLQLPSQVLRKLYHENAVRWIPGIMSHASGQ